MTGGADQETDDELRVRVLDRIRKPPMGGDADDYVAWALSVAGVTRAWCSPLEMGMGTVTVRFMCDDLRASNGGFPNASDVAAVQAFLDTVRPVAVKDIFVLAPTPQPISLAVRDLDKRLGVSAHGNRRQHPARCWSSGPRRPTRSTASASRLKRSTSHGCPRRFPAPPVSPASTSS